MIQEVGKVASSVADGLKAQPALLAIVVLNCLAIGIGIWFMSKVVDASQRNMQTILTACLDHSNPP